MIANIYGDFKSDSLPYQPLVQVFSLSGVVLHTQCEMTLCAKIFIAALFVVARVKTPKCPLYDTSCTVGYCATFRKNVSKGLIGKIFQSVLLNEKVRLQSDGHHRLRFIRALQGRT